MPEPQSTTAAAPAEVLSSPWGLGLLWYHPWMGIHQDAQQVWDAAEVDPDYAGPGTIDKIEIELRKDGSAEVVAYNEGGHNFTRVDLGKLFRFVADTPELAHLLPQRLV